MFLLLVAATAAAASNGTYDNWQLGGGQSWITASSALECSDHHYQCAVKALRRNDVQVAVSELGLAARQRDPRAMREIGLMKLRGDILKRDDAGAVGWLYEAALVGDRPSMQMLAYAFANGIGVSPDKNLSDYWGKRAANAR
ncbi:MAG: sel1 repeat family protein [Sphingomonas sp.]|nr:sel1 repeat family protein [Sphingomonas sp.]